MLTVRPGTSLDEDAALALWQADLARREQRGGGTRATAFRQRLRSPQALLLVAVDDSRDRGDQVLGVLLAELGRADAEGAPVGDGDGALVPGLLHVGALAVRPGTTAQRALLAAVTGRFPWITAWTPDPGAFELAGFARTGRQRDDEVHVERRA